LLSPLAIIADMLRDIFWLRIATLSFSRYYRRSAAFSLAAFRYFSRRQVNDTSRGRLPGRFIQLRIAITGFMNKDSRHFTSHG